jgi:hypothetical protein
MFLAIEHKQGGKIIAARENAFTNLGGVLIKRKDMPRNELKTGRGVEVLLTIKPANESVKGTTLTRRNGNVD